MYEEDMDQVKRCNSGSLSESDECRNLTAASGDKTKDSELKKKHRRGRKRNRPKWKPYAKMSEEERRKWDVYEQSRMAQKEKRLAIMSRRPVAPFNTTQFIMEDRTDSQVYKPHPSETNRCMSFDSSTSGGVADHIAMANPIISLSPPLLETPFSPPLSLSPLSPSLIFLGEESFEAEDENFHEQEAFLEADFNQVYTQLRLDRLEVMNKQDLVQECFSLEDRIATVEQERADLHKQVEELEDTNRMLSEDNSKLCCNPLPVKSS